jgi:hypothetical protein
MRSRGSAEGRGGEGQGGGEVLSPGDLPAPGQSLSARKHIDLAAVDSRAAGSAPETSSSENDRRERDVSRPSKRPVVEGPENEGECVKKRACAQVRTRQEGLQLVPETGTSMTGRRRPCGTGT